LSLYLLLLLVLAFIIVRPDDGSMTAFRITHFPRSHTYLAIRGKSNCTASVPAFFGVRLYPFIPFTSTIHQHQGFIFSFILCHSPKLYPVIVSPHLHDSSQRLHLAISHSTLESSLSQYHFLPRLFSLRNHGVHNREERDKRTEKEKAGWNLLIQDGRTK
jgi:hypothetical protein